MSDDACIFHITQRSDWQAALRAGSYRPASLAGEGFIHLSSAHQVLPVARAFYAGQPGLVLLLVDPTLLSSPLKYEAAPPGDAFAGEQRFPHLYGALDIDAVVDVIELDRFDGRAVHADTVAALRTHRFQRLPVEGTLYRETWRSVERSPGGGPAGTAMLGLYADSPQSLSCMHRLTHDEVWHAHGPDPFVLLLLHADGRSEEVLMGLDAAAGQEVQCTVPAGTWQGGHLVPGGRHALFGCTMAPGFTGDLFEAADTDTLCAQYPQRAETIRRLAVNGSQRRMPAGFAGASSGTTTSTSP